MDCKGGIPEPLLPLGLALQISSLFKKKYYKKEKSNYECDYKYNRVLLFKSRFHYEPGIFKASFYMINVDYLVNLSDPSWNLLRN